MKSNWPTTPKDPPPKFGGGPTGQEKLGEVCEFVRSGITPFDGEKEYIDTNSVQDFSIVKSQKITYEKRPSRANMEAKTNDVLVAKMKDTLKVYLATLKDEKRRVFSTGFFISRPKKNFIEPKYLFLYYSSNLFQNLKDELARGSTQKAINDEKLKKYFEIPLPPIKIQKQIVARIEKLFEKIDKAKELRRRAQEQTANIFTAALREIFLDTKKKKWQSDRIRNLIENIQTGTTPPSKVRKYYNGNIQWFTPGDLGNNKFLTSSARTITKIAVKEGKTRLFKKGTLLFVGIGATLGKVGIANKEVSANQQITGLYFKKLIIPEFVYYWFLYNYDYIRSISPSATLPILNQEGLKDLIINFPSLSEQKKIVVYLDSLREKVDKLKQFQQSQLKELTELKQSILAKAFKG